MLAAELFMHGVISLAAMKELFAILLFSESHPADHAVSLACHAFLRTGPFLDSSELGMKMVEYLVLRLKEVKGLNLSIATRQSITDVVELQKNRWEPSRMGMTREKTSGQKKARAAARTRARMLITRVQEGVSDPWAGLSNDARALTALLEFAAARDPAAEEALATAPDELIDQLPRRAVSPARIVRWGVKTASCHYAGYAYRLAPILRSCRSALISWFSMFFFSLHVSAQLHDVPF